MSDVWNNLLRVRANTNRVGYTEPYVVIPSVHLSASATFVRPYNESGISLIGCRRSNPDSITSNSTILLAVIPDSLGECLCVRQPSNREGIEIFELGCHRSCVQSSSICATGKLRGIRHSIRHNDREVLVSSSGSSRKLLGENILGTNVRIVDNIYPVIGTRRINRKIGNHFHFLDIACVGILHIDLDSSVYDCDSLSRSEDRSNSGCISEIQSVSRFVNSLNLHSRRSSITHSDPVIRLERGSGNYLYPGVSSDSRGSDGRSYS